MHGSQLLGASVFDSAGERVGTIHDLKFVMDHVPGAWPHIELVGFRCGQAARGHRLGYDTSTMAGPWLLKKLFRMAHSKRIEVQWADVAEVADRTVRLKRTKDTLGNR